MQREELQQKFARSQKLFGEIHFLEEKLAQSERLLRTQAKTEVEIDFLKRRIDAAKQLLAIKRTEWAEINRQLTNAQSSSLPATGEARPNNSAKTTAKSQVARVGGGNRKKSSKLRKTRSKKSRSHRR
jgi:hypothetical protein